MAGLLDVFGVMFESDADDVKKGADEAGKSTEELEKKLVDTDKAAEGLGGSFLDLIGSAKGAIAGVLSLGALTAGVVATAAMTDEIGKFSQTLGLNIEDVGAWGEAVVRSGGDAGAFQSSIEGLTKGLTDFAVTGGGTLAETFARIGVSATDSSGKVKSAFDVLPELADSFEGLSDAESAGLGDRLGLDQGTILLLQQGRHAVEELVDRQKQLGVATQEDYEIAALFNDQWADTKQVFQSLFVTSGSTILPLFTMILKGVEKLVFFLADHEALVSGFFIGVAGVILTVYGPAMAIAAAETLIAIAPLLLIAAAAAAFGAAIAIVVDDIYNFIQGNDSLIGNIAEKYPAIGRFVTEIGNAIKFVIDTVSDLGSALVGVFAGEGGNAVDALANIIDGLFASIDAVLGLLYGLADAFVTAFTSPQEALNMLIDSFKNFAASVTDLLPDIGGAVDDVADFFGFGSDDKTEDVSVDLDKQNQIIEKNIKAANNVFANVDTNPLNGQTTNSINTANQSSRVTNVSVGKVDVNTQATDADGIAKATGGALQSEMQTAVNNMDDGVAY